MVNMKQKQRFYSVYDTPISFAKALANLILAASSNSFNAYTKPPSAKGNSVTVSGYNSGQP